MASGAFLFSTFFTALLSLPSAINGGALEKLQQPQASVWVLPGEDLHLQCWVSEELPAGPVKWYLGEDPQRKLIYTDKQTPGNNKRIERNSPTSNTDFTIIIRNATLEDAGTYYCVKEKKSVGDNEDWLRGHGTVVVVTDTPVPPVAAVTPVAVGVSVPILVGLFCAALCFYMKKKRRLRSSSSRSDTSFQQKPQFSKQTSGDKEIIYADLKGPSGLQIPAKTNLEERLEYATIKGALTGGTEKGPFSA